MSRKWKEHLESGREHLAWKTTGEQQQCQHPASLQQENPKTKKEQSIERVEQDPSFIET